MMNQTNNQLHLANNTALFLPPMMGGGHQPPQQPMMSPSNNTADASQLNKGQGGAASNFKGKRSGGSRNTPLTGNS